MPSVVLMPVKVNASMLCIPMDWATKDEPQMMAVIRSSTIPIGLVRRIVFPFFMYKAKEIYIKAVGFARCWYWNEADLLTKMRFLGFGK